MILTPRAYSFEALKMRFSEASRVTAYETHLKKILIKRMLVHRLGLLRCLGHRLIKLGFVFGRGWQRQVRARSSSMTRPVHRLQLSRSFRT